jgi:hypothetical protein
MCGVGFLCFLVTYKFEVSTIYATKTEQKLKKFVEHNKNWFFCFFGVWTVSMNCIEIFLAHELSSSRCS